MIIDHFRVVRLPALPAETDAKSIVDAYALLTCAVACQLLQVVAGRNARVVQR